MPEHKRSFFMVFLLDGMADWPCDELGGKTPLEAAGTPVLDGLAEEGALGLLKTVPDSLAPGSEVANLCILSYDPRSFNLGRGVLEAASMGVELLDGDLAMRCNLVTLHGDRMEDHSAGHISSPEGAQLIEGLNQKLGSSRVTLYPGVSYRHLLVIKGGSLEVECTPPHDILGQEYGPYLPRPRSPSGGETARLLRNLIHESRPILADHPVNSKRKEEGKPTAASLWPWAPGSPPELVPFSELFSLRGAVISAVDLIRGIGKLAGMTVLEVPGATGMPETNYRGKAEAAVSSLADHDFVYVHVEGPDEAGHMADPELKARTLEWCDKRLIGRACELLKEKGLMPGTRIAVLSDHFTPCKLRTHHTAPVPYLIWGRGVEKDSQSAFSEKTAVSGGLGLKDGLDFLPFFLSRPRRA